MRILTKKQAKEGLDIDYIYRHGKAIAIVDSKFDKKYDIIPKKTIMRGSE